MFCTAQQKKTGVAFGAPATPTNRRSELTYIRRSTEYNDSGIKKRSTEYKIIELPNITTPKWIEEVPKWYSDWSTCTVFYTPEPKLMHLRD